MECNLERMNGLGPTNCLMNEEALHHHNMLVCGSTGNDQLALFPHQLDEIKELGIMDQQTGGLFDYIPIKLEKLLISHDEGEQVVNVVVGTTFTLYLSSFSRVYYCGKSLLFNDECSKIVNSEVPSFRWVFFFDPVNISELEGVNGLICVEHITCGAKHCAFLLSNHSVYVAGNNEMGQIGMGRNVSLVSYPQRLEIGYSTSRQSSGSEEDSEEELDNLEPMQKKRKVQDISTHITKIKCSYDNTVLQTADGFVYASGDNEYHQIYHSQEEGKVFEFKRLFFKELSLDQYKNIKEIIVMDSFMLALTNEGRLYISEGGKTFEKMGLDIDYFNTIDFPRNSIVQIFKTSYAFFVKTSSGEVFYLQQGLTKMVKSALLSYKNFIIGSGRFHVVSISTDMINQGFYEAIGYNKFGNLGFRSSEDTVKVPQSIPKVTNWIQKSLHLFEYKLAADFFNTIVYRVRDLKREASQKIMTSLISKTQIRHYTDLAITCRFGSYEEAEELRNIGKIQTTTSVAKQEKKTSFDEGTSNEQLNHIMNLMTTGGNNASKN